MFVSFTVSLGDEEETEKTEDSDHSSDDEEAVRDPSLGVNMMDNWGLADLSKRSSSTKYFSLHSTSVELVIRQSEGSGGMLSGFIKAVCSGIHMDDPKP